MASDWRNPASLTDPPPKVSSFLFPNGLPDAQGNPAKPQGPKRLSDAEYKALEPREKIAYARNHDQTEFEGKWPASTAREPRFWPEGWNEEKALASRQMDRYGRRVDR